MGSLALDDGIKDINPRLSQPSAPMCPITQTPCLSALIICHFLMKLSSGSVIHPPEPLSAALKSSSEVLLSVPLASRHTQWADEISRRTIFPNSGEVRDSQPNQKHCTLHFINLFLIGWNFPHLLKRYNTQRTSFMLDGQSFVLLVYGVTLRAKVRLLLHGIPC